MYLAIHVLNENDNALNIRDKMKIAAEDFGVLNPRSYIRSATWNIWHILGENIGRAKCVIVEFELEEDRIPLLQERLISVTGDPGLLISTASGKDKLFAPQYEQPVTAEYILGERHITKENGKEYFLRYASGKIFELMHLKIISQEGCLIFSEVFDDPDRPFDAFISCHEVNEDGSPSLAHELATDIEHALIAMGYKVYRPQSALRNCPEPFNNYIQAFNTSKTFIFVGSEPSHFNDGNVWDDLQRLLWLDDYGHPSEAIFAGIDMNPDELREEYGDADLMDGRSHDFLEKLLMKVRVNQANDTRDRDEMLRTAVPPYYEKGQLVNDLRRGPDPNEIVYRMEYITRIVDDLIPRLQQRGSYLRYDYSINTIYHETPNPGWENVQIKRLVQQADELLLKLLNVQGEKAANIKRIEKLEEQKRIVEEYIAELRRIDEAKREIYEAEEGIRSCSGFLQGGKRRKLEENLTRSKETLRRAELRLKEYANKNGGILPKPDDLRDEIQMLATDIAESFYAMEDYKQAGRYYRECKNAGCNPKFNIHEDEGVFAHEASLKLKNDPLLK